MLDGNLLAQPLLCKEWATKDNITFTFEIMPGVTMSDGSWLNAGDVAYSIRQAMQKGRYASRLKSINSVTSDGDLTVTIALFSPNCRFINLLDVPIIKSGSIDSSIPPGSGPYFFASEEAMQLDRLPLHRDYYSLPVTTVYLKECEDNQLTEMFDDGELSLLWDDPSDSFDLRINRLPEKRFYNTTAFHFIGFNARRSLMADPYVRSAIGCSVDRQYIVENILVGQHAIPAPLALSPAFWLYDEEWERRDLDPLVEMTLLLVNAGLEDFNDDSFLEKSDWLGGYEEFTVDFIVNEENPHRCLIAHKIADTLRRTGFNITVRELPWDGFLDALQAGNFDMYYGEIVLGADFDLSPLLLPGGLNYGRTANSDYIQFIDDFLIARSDDEVRYAAKRLCDEISANAPFVPILYKKYAVYSPMGAVSGAEPSQSGVFYNFAKWTINRMMLN